MRIAIDLLSAKSLYHGMGVYIKNFLCHLIPRGEGHFFLLFVRKKVFSQFGLEKEKNLKIVEVNPNHLPRILYAHTFLPLVLSQERVDLFWGPANFLPPFKACKYVVTIHDISSFIFPQSYPLLRRLYYQSLIKRAVRFADLIISVSEATKKDIIKYFPHALGKIYTLHEGVDEIFLRTIAPEKVKEVKEKYRLPENFIFSLGVLEPKKNWERILLGYAELKKELPSSLKLVIGGSKSYGWKNKRIFWMVEKLNLADDVIFLGTIPPDDLPAIYTSSSLFLYPSLYEGFGLPVVEAMACGVPVITSNISSLPEVAGDAAILVNPQDVSEMTRAMKEVLLDEKKRREMIEKGKRNVQRFSWQKSAERLFNLFAEVVKR